MSFTNAVPPAHAPEVRRGRSGTPAADPLPLAHAFRALEREPLLSLPALAHAAARLSGNGVERRVHDAATGAQFRILPGEAELAQRLAAEGPSREWVMLRGIENLPEYAALLDRLMESLPPAILTKTGAPVDIKGFVFLSAPQTHTPLHFDAEYNVLFQVAGTKTFATYPPREPFLSRAEREAYHATGENLLSMTRAHADCGTRHELAPGDALFVPYCAPHWVRSGPGTSISLSLTWQSAWSRDVAEAERLGPVLRRLGLALPDPALSRRRPRLAALASRIVQRAARIAPPGGGGEA